MTTQAEALAAEITRAARAARSEEDFKIAVEQALAPMRAELNISPSYETTYSATVSVLGGGSSDAVYGHAVIEYKKPGRLATPAGRREATNELQRYLTAEASRYGHEWAAALRRMIGIAIDGQTIFFVRFRGERLAAGPPIAPIPTHQMSLFAFEGDETPGFVPIGPYPVDADSVGLLLVYLRALRRRALTPEALAKEFGPDGEIARDLVSGFYSTVLAGSQGSQSVHPRVKTLFQEWDRLFGIVYGQDVEKAKRDAHRLASLYGVAAPAELKPLLFAVHTYYALLMKLLAAELASLQGGSPLTSPLAGMPGMSGSNLRERLRDLEDGGLFARYGIHNFLEGDFFGWYVDAWRPEFESPIRTLARTLADFEPATGSILPEATRDLLKKLYQYLVPKELRHDLGEYYTPDWLAELTLLESGYNGAQGKRFLDPACGSGTFLVLAIRRAREWAEDNLIDQEELAKHILANIVGFDLNPLAVIAARTNYLLALGTLVRRLSAIEIPVYLCDSVLTPATGQPTGSTQSQAFVADYELSSTVGAFAVPREIVDSGQVPQLTVLLEECVRRRYPLTDFEERARRELAIGDEDVLASLRSLFTKLEQLETEGRDGLWARLLKNAFAPVFTGRFDFVVGNPPWIRWGYLSDSYRAATLSMWSHYGLFSLKGLAARLGSGEKDFSMLFTYTAADNYLTETGTLAFLITQEVMKGKGAGEGFRRFRLGAAGPHLQVLHAHDFVQVQPFEGAANKTAMIVLRKGSPTSYPVPYSRWSRHHRSGPVPTDSTLRHALDRLDREDLIARPISAVVTSPWQTIPEVASSAFEQLGGASTYVARRGAGTDPYGVFWFKVHSVTPEGNVIVENLPELGEREVPKRTDVVLESELLHPAIRGSDIARWSATPRVHVLVTQDPKTRRPIPGSEMRVSYPKTFGYLNGFRDILLTRGSNTIRELALKTEPWAMFGIGEYTFAPFRVAWKRMASDLVAAVLGTWHTIYGDRMLLPTETTSFIPVDDEDEAYYLAAILNSTPVRSYVRSFSSAGRGFGAPSVITQTGIPTFHKSQPAHMQIAQIGRVASGIATTEGQPLPDIHDLDRDLDLAVANLFGISDKQLRALAKVAVTSGPMRLRT